VISHGGGGHGGGGARAVGGIAGGVLALLGWARVNHSWPFASVQVREVYLELQNGAADHASADAPA
jgi:hypothetical protein